MATNHWLKKFKAIKKNVELSTVRLYCYATAEERWYYPPYKPLALEVKWDGDEFLSPPHVAGVAMFDRHGVGPIWHQDTSHIRIISKGDAIRYDFSKMVVEYKWKIEDFLTKEEEDD